MSKLLRIAIKKAKRMPMIELQSAFVSIQNGVADDFRGKPGKRQVTVLDVGSWNEACNMLGTQLDWTTRRSNLLVDGLDLNKSAGKFIVVGNVVLEITQETDPCSRMDEAHDGLFDALKTNWRGGVCCQVVRNGEIKVGDVVRLLSKAPTHLSSQKEREPLYNGK